MITETELIRALDIVEIDHATATVKDGGSFILAIPTPGLAVSIAVISDGVFKLDKSVEYTKLSAIIESLMSIKEYVEKVDVFDQSYKMALIKSSKVLSKVLQDLPYENELGVVRYDEMVNDILPTCYNIGGQIFMDSNTITETHTVELDELFNLRALYNVSKSILNEDVAHMDSFYVSDVDDLRIATPKQTIAAAEHLVYLKRMIKNKEVEQ